MSEKTKVDVLIAGNAYTILGPESDEYIQRVGLYVDRKLSEVLRNNDKLSTSTAAILTAINIADDFFKAHENELSFKREIVSSKLEIERLINENTTLEDKNKALVTNYNNMQIEKAKREAELAELRNSITQMRKGR
ncbi:MAG: cell division protein ZapA [Oscillospiraceae bacterium]|nr:cell division protein ZapA [Oscillospiraceae bacterium]